MTVVCKFTYIYIIYVCVCVYNILCNSTPKTVYWPTIYIIYIYEYTSCAHYYTRVCFAQPRGKSHSGHKVNLDGIWRSSTLTYTHNLTHTYTCVYVVGDRNCNGSSDNVAGTQDDTSGTRFRSSAVVVLWRIILVRGPRMAVYAHTSICRIYKRALTNRTAVAFYWPFTTGQSGFRRPRDHLYVYINYTTVENDDFLNAKTAII